MPDYTGNQSSQSLPKELGILKSKRVREIQCLRDAFMICTNYVQSNSYITNVPLNAVEAGKKHRAFANLIDSNYMFVNEPLDKVSALCFNGEGKISKGECQAYWDESRYVIELNITEAGYHSLYGFVNGMLLANSPVIYTVKHGEFKEAKVFVNSEEMIVNAGVGFTVLVQILDKYGNLVLEEPKLDLSLNVSGHCQILDYAEGCFRVSVYCTSIGKHNLQVLSGTKPLQYILQDNSEPDNIVDLGTRETISVQVLPGLISPAYCSVEGLKNEYFANDIIEFKIISRDQYGNTTWHRSAPWSVELPLSYEIIDSDDFCMATIKTKCLKTGQLPIKIAYIDQILLDKNVTIFPGPLYIPHTLITGDGSKNSLFSQPRQAEFSIEFYDEFCNPCPTSLTVETSAKHNIQQLQIHKYAIDYSIPSPGEYKFILKPSHGNIVLKVLVTKDPKLIKQEQIEQELERKRKQMLEEQKNLEELERKKRIEEENRRKQELLQKEKQMKIAESKQKELEAAELLRRQKIIERIKQQEITKKRAQEALQQLAEEQEKKKREQKKWKRTGGGFTVPFIVEDL